MPCYAIDGLIPVVDPAAFVHPDAVLIGDVIIEAGVYVGPGASLRGDFGRVILRAGSNLQDNCVMHSFPGREAVVEPDGHVGHGAILHGCVVGRNALVGMNAVVMDDVRVGAESIIGAMSFVKAGMVIPPRSLVLGIPARIVGTVSDADIAWKGEGTAVYHRLVGRCRASLRPCQPLAAAEPDRPRIVEDATPRHVAREAVSRPA